MKKALVGAFKAALGGATILSAVAMMTTLASAQSAGAGGAGCGITQAADLAVQRQIALLDAAKVNPSEFFNGANSCLGTNLLDSLDLSNLIPTSFDFLGGVGDNLINGLIQRAQQQVCQVLNDQLQSVVGRINQNMFSFESAMGGQMNNLLGGSGGNVTRLTLPDIPGLGQYTFASNTSQTINGINGPITRPPSVQVSPGAASQGSGSTGDGSSNPFGNLFQ